MALDKLSSYQDLPGLINERTSPLAAPSYQIVARGLLNLFGLEGGPKEWFLGGFTKLKTSKKQPFDPFGG